MTFVPFAMADVDLAKTLTVAGAGTNTGSAATIISKEIRHHTVSVVSKVAKLGKVKSEVEAAAPTFKTSSTSKTR